MSTSTQPTILVVEDERELADLYATWVSEDYEVYTAYDGRTALESMSEAVDVVLLDRHMPDVPGDEVLNRIRAAGHDCWVTWSRQSIPDSTSSNSISTSTSPNR